MILEHWCDFNEERELADYNGMNGNAAGLMLWANATSAYQEASMGYSNNDLSWANFQSHNFQDRHAVAYAESHDEERLMYKNLEFGNSSETYDASDEVIALRRQQLSMAFNLLMPGPRLLWQFEELGYDYSINTCTDGVTVTEDCRVVAKPVRWDYYEDNERRHLYDVTGALGRLKKSHPAFGTSASSFNVDVGGFGKRMHFEHPDGDAIVVGNFRTTTLDMIPGFTHTGTWFDYLSGEALEVTDLNASMSFEPGEMHVYTDQPMDVPTLAEIDMDLDGQLASQGDCNDNDATIYAGAPDTVDNIDQDCNGLDGCMADADADGICDDVDECVGELDECGVCNGPGAVLECGCNDIPEEDCDCDGNQFDAIGICGGDCLEDLDQDGICDDVDGIEGFDNPIETTWSLYPNPSSDVVKLKFDQGQEPTALQLRDMRGRQVSILFTALALVIGLWT